MSTLHITLVGEQPEPIYYVINELKPDAVVYVCSKQTESKAKAIQELACIEKHATVIIDPTDANEISNCADYIAEEFSGYDTTLNISGGSKPWAYIFGIKFGTMPNATVLFLDQNNVLWNYKTMTGTTINYKFDILTALKLRGHQMSQYHDFSCYVQKDIETMRQIEAARSFNHQAFTNLMSVLEKEKQTKIKRETEGIFYLQQKGHEADNNNYVEWFKPSKENPDGLVRINLVSRKGDTERFETESPHAIDLAFNSGWFEFKIARMIANWNKVKKIYMNCVFPFNSNIDKNEIDIIVETDKKAIFVECKTQITKPSDIDKFRSAVKNYGGTSTTGLFISEGKLGGDIKAKCADNSLQCFSLNDYRGNVANAEQALIDLLERIYHTINTR